MNCSGWVLDIWSSSKEDRTEVDNIDRMCPEDNRREYSVPGMLGKKTIHSVSHNILYCYRVSSVYSYQLPYSVEWDSVLPVPSQGSQIQQDRDTQTHKTQTHTVSVACFTAPARGVVGMAVMATITQR